MTPFDPNFFVVPHWPLMGIALVIAIRLMLPKSRTTPLEVTRELIIVIPGYLLYTTVRGLVEGREAEAFSRAADVIHLERALGIFWETDVQRHILNDRLLVSLANSTYAWAHWPLIITTAVWLFFRHRDVYPLYRNAFLISGAIALVIYATLPVAPPRFLDAWGFVDTIAVRSAAYQLLQPPAFVNQYAAMPSLHVGWNLLAGIAIVRHGPALRVKIIGVVLPVAMFLSTVSTANHFIIDCLAGGGVALLALALALTLRGLLQRQGSDRRQRLPSFAVGLV